MSKAYWSSLALKMAIDQQESPVEHDNDLKEHLQHVWHALVLYEQDSQILTGKGRCLFDKHSILHDRARYWLQDRFITEWTFKCISHKTVGSNKNYFSDIARTPTKVALTQRVLDSYVRDDCEGMDSILSKEFSQSSVIVDLGGGMGAPLRELATSCSMHQHLICMDRLEVIGLAAFHKNIEFRSGYLFSGVLPSADGYILSRVLHDWPDDQVQLILARILVDRLCIIECEIDSNLN
jgi:hypothetical protein